MHQESLGPLLSCMPEDVWDEEDEECLHRPVIPVDWKRPFIYSSRVRSFKYDDSVSRKTVTRRRTSRRFGLHPRFSASVLIPVLRRIYISRTRHLLYLLPFPRIYLWDSTSSVT
ncbi:hypothetical protein C8R44DRAFT_195023 [Mycena epipterygia]|nr:hypothetical protein C8R44DRAFT_195023 [Mycena epipterygia]